MNETIESRWYANKVWWTGYDESKSIVKISVTCLTCFNLHTLQGVKSQGKRNYKEGRKKELAMVPPWENSSPHLTLREPWPLGVIWRCEAELLSSRVFGVTRSGWRIFSPFPLQPQVGLNLFGLRDHLLSAIVCSLSAISARRSQLQTFFLIYDLAIKGWKK